ncbi:MAG TPA: type I-E CRISPR-associated protein Cas7/Cse4/CasC, partial [Chloroflexi bacterium]|nr:type I-E CRISPR-associated protein Cas7/Cse4/CasC [Chloroflexota bacterium]
MKMYIEVHMIQNFAPANLNRDDTNNPKDCEFGGVRRARISSQCIKRAIRTSRTFKEVIGQGIAIRTRYLSRELHRRLADRGYPQEEVYLIATTFPQALTNKRPIPKQAERTDIPLYIGDHEIEIIVEALCSQWEQVLEETKRFQQEKTQAKTPTIARLVRTILKEIKQAPAVPDVALFGRMLASHPRQFNVEAACQVAHAISTHRVAMEMDFFTAVEELLKAEDEETGAAMMDVTGFNSAC